MEIIIVVAIIAVLVSTGYPHYNRAKLEARRAEAQSAAVALEAVVERYLAENNKAILDSTDISASFANYDPASVTPVYTNNGYYRMTLETDSTGHIITATAVAGAGLTSCADAGNEN